MKLSAILAPLIAAKVPHEVIMQTVQAWENEHSNALEKRREADRKRQAKRRGHVMSRDVTVTDSSRTRVEDNNYNNNITGKDIKVASPKAQPSRGTRIPDDFQPDIQAAVAEGVPLSEAERQAKSFCDYWRAKPGKDGLKLDWPATWRVWYRRNISSKPKPQSHAPPPKPKTIGQMFLDDLERLKEAEHAKPDHDTTRQNQASERCGQGDGAGLPVGFAITGNELGRF